MNVFRSTTLAAFTVALIAACGGDGTGAASGAQGVSISVHPASVEVMPGGTMSFGAAVTGAAVTAVRWSIVEGSPLGGAVSSSGIYTAPGVGGTYHVVATSVADATKAATATVTVTGSSGGGTGGNWVNGEWSTCKSEPLQAGTVHYYCDCQAGAAAGCVAGNDSNAGTSAATPRRSLGNAIGVFASLAPGDTLAFCRGGSFGSTGGNWNNSSATAANPVMVRDYVAPWNSGSEGRPILGSQITFNGPAGGYRLLNLKLSGSGSGYGVLAYGGIHDVSLCNMEISGFDIGVYAQLAQRTKVTGSRFLDNASMAWLSDGDGTEIRNSYFWNNGYGNTVFLHSIYLGGGSTSHNEVVSGNEIYAPANAVGSVLAVHGAHQYTTIENNLISCDRGSANTAWGINMKSGDYGSPEFNDDLVVRGNRVLECGNTAVNATSCRRCLFENNVVVNTSQPTSGISVPNQPANTAKGDPVSDSITVRNNTVYTTQAGGAAISVGVEGVGHVVANNVVQANSGTACYAWPGGATYVQRDYNLCAGGSSPSPGAHSLNADPQFVNAPGDLRPTASSPLVGASDSTETPATDLTGKVRPVPGALGAYEP